MNRIARVAVTCFAASMAACDLPVEIGELTGVDLAALAPAFDAASSSVYDAAATSDTTAASQDTLEFTRTEACPVSGAIDITGTVHRDSVNGAASFNFVTTTTHAACGFDRNGTTVVFDGEPNIQTRAQREVEAGVIVGGSTVHTGTFRWTSRGFSGTCDVALTSTIDAAAQTVALTGTFCGVEVNQTRPWSGAGSA
jgi:hypothetical protein